MGDITVQVQSVSPTATSDLFEYSGVAVCEGMGLSDAHVPWAQNVSSSGLAAAVNLALVEAAIAAADAHDPSWSVGPTDKKTLVGGAVDVVVV